MNTITIHNCHEFTDEQIIDFAAKKLSVQGCKSEKGGRCLYRGPNNTKCAFGLFIPDEDYKISMENVGAETIIDEYFPTAENKKYLFYTLQKVHDFDPPERWASIFGKLKTAKGVTWDDKYHNSK